MAKEDNTNIQLHLLEPRATEKSYLEQTNRKEFNVTVTDVRTLIRNGKKTKFSKGKHAYPGITYRQDKKFAYVRLKQGDSIKVFDEPESETSAKEAKADKKAKKADKNAGKENK